jgi:hypothetical protein
LFKNDAVFHVFFISQNQSVGQPRTHLKAGFFFHLCNTTKKS